MESGPCLAGLPLLACALSAQRIHAQLKSPAARRNSPQRTLPYRDSRLGEWHRSDPQGPLLVGLEEQLEASARIGPEGRDGRGPVEGNDARGLRGTAVAQKHDTLDGRSRSQDQGELLSRRNDLLRPRRQPATTRRVARSQHNSDDDCLTGESHDLGAPGGVGDYTPRRGTRPDQDASARHGRPIGRSNPDA